MLLCLQHMEEENLHNAQHAEVSLQTLPPIQWGTLSVQFDMAAMVVGTLNLLHFRGILSDGTFLAIERTSNRRPPCQPIAPYFGDRPRSLLVYIALPLLGENVDIDRSRQGQEDQPRRPAPLFVFEGQSRDNFATLPIAELERDAGGFRLSDSFIPPSLSLGAAPALTTTLHDVVSCAVTRRRTLIDERRAREAAGIDSLTRRELEKMFLLHALDTSLPWLKHCCDTPSTHPLTVYHALIQFAGSLMTVATEGDPTELPPFQYDDLRGTFAPLGCALRRLLSQEFDQLCIELPLRIHQGTSWIGQINNERLLHCTTFVLAIAIAGDLVVANREIPEIIRIASWRRIAKIVSTNALGVLVRSCVRPPSEVPILPRHAYFIVDLQDPVWHELIAERRIAVYLRAPYDPPRAKVRLFGIPRRE